MIVHGLLARVDDGLQEEVRLLQLVVEEQVVLRELDARGQVLLLDHFGAQYVHACKEPASA